jgi:predicted ribosomally synthesized peptide with SipW-like signal peptide
VKLKLASPARSATKLLLLALLFGLSTTWKTGAYFSDQEKSEGNQFVAASLDLAVTSGQSNSVPNADSLEPGDWVARDIRVVQQPGSIPLKHMVSYQFVDGNEELCDQLELKICITTTMARLAAAMLIGICG